MKRWRFPGRTTTVLALAVAVLLVMPHTSSYAASWAMVSQPGFGDPSNIGVYGLAEFNGFLYAGTRRLTGGCEVWRSRDGTGWTLANKRGFEDANNWSAWCMTVFSNKLYAGTYNETTGGEIWASSNGTNWTQVNTDGFGDAKNKGIYSLCVFGGDIYAGTYNQTDGGELWRSSSGSAWTACATPFPWTASNQGIYSLSVFGGALYAGTSNQAQGCELWKSTNGNKFDKIGENGFGDANNKYIYCQKVFKGNLFVGTYNIINGCEVWRSADGENWTQANTNGFGDLMNKSVWSFGIFADNLYAGTWKEGGGSELWRTPDGSAWVQANADGFGNANNQLTLSMCTFGNYIYCGTYNSAQGGETFRYGPLSDLALPDLWYFAEGTTRDGFHTWLCLQNPQEMDAQVDITYMLSSSEYRLQQVTVPALSRQTVDVNGFIAGEKDFATKVVSSQPILVERPMYFDYNGKWPGGHVVIGAPSGRTSWYFAEGTTLEDFDEWICLENPGGSTAETWITYMLGSGENVEQGVPVPANSRITVNVRAAVGDNQDVSTHVASDNPIIAERSMYFNYKGRWPGGSVVMGAAEPSDTWYFAEGTTLDGFDTWLCLQNPGEKEATVTASFMPLDRAVEEREIKVPAKSRFTYSVNNALGPNVDTSTLLTSDQPIIAERSMYFNYHENAKGGHVVVGANEAKNTWFFAEGTTRAGYDEWLCIQNPGETDVEVTITYILLGAEPTTQVVKIAKQSRYTVSVNDAVGADRDVSAKVTAPSPIIVERPMYFDIEDGANGGHVVMGFGVD
ncbi:MAG: hypothetical protein KKE79_05375 [Actinobacteria bacterium]|nr:hypothetical protein [Actinomycetota bacterium]